ncbi:MAG TPA: MFS transporter [Pseudomonadales bacterium]|jgi:MFS family permease|nr:MFS transporter [Pseudomonadales bacterium]
MAFSLGPLARHRDFVHLWSAQSVSAFGSRITRTALPVIAILLVTDDPVQIATLGVLTVIPGVIVGLFAGGFIDRHAKRPILVWSDIVRALLVLSIPIAAWSAHLGIVQLYVVAALVGGFSALFRLADNAYLPVLIGRDLLLEGNSKLQVTDSVAEIGGPGLAGVLIQWLTAPVTMVIDALSYLVSAVLLARIRTNEVLQAAAATPPTLLQDVRIGARAGFGHPIVGATFWSFAIDDFANGFFMALYMLYGLRTLSIDVATMGIVISLGGVGALAGAFVASTVSRRLGLGRAMIVTFLIGKLANLFVAFASIAPQYAVVWLSASQLFSDGAIVSFLILANSYRQTVLPLDVMARANGLLEVMSGVLLPLGAVIAGLLAKATSVTFAVWVGCVLGLFAVLPLLRPRIASLTAPAIAA